ncbi:hypothetical protein Cabys_2732 [Caldithrix abyssi DSM 13497]|uniref:Uncharacterized protein n=1 Tax=Caldithrix abyssi DSM 13497 TaxID=880073 RepID=A0A1J1CC50_CALAY|nr:hypothetical protein Cabys_2732 [Caldithrix abyssi DSM 13497]
MSCKNDLRKNIVILKNLGDIQHVFHILVNKTYFNYIRKKGI